MTKKDKLFKKEKTALMVIDLQEKLLPHVWRTDFITENLIRLIKTAQILDMPIVVTEHYPRGLGATVPQIKALIEEFDPLEKIIFGAVDESAVLNRLKELRVRNLLITGIETHICVTQTTLQALRNDFRVHVISDAVSSRTEENWNVGIERVRHAGAVVSSTEMAIYELLYRADIPEFKEVLKFIV